MSAIVVEDYSPDHAEAARSVINGAFGFQRSSDWFVWKHLDGPWGPSSGVIARDERGIVGVRLLLPWLFRVGDTEVLAYRAVEAATAPRAQGKGVFRELNGSLMERLAASPLPTFVYSTPNDQSRDGYKKLGWKWLEPFPHEYRLAPARRPKADGRTRLEGPDAIATFSPMEDPHGQVLTSWNPAAIGWRFDRRSGNCYRALALRSSDGTGGIVYRTLAGRKIPTLLPMLTWGSAALVHDASAIVARKERAPIVLDVPDPGRGRTLRLRHGESLVTVWASDDRWMHDNGVGDSDRWRVSFADLESVL
ncbi:MAG: GNAT family N-acetyltransferase [Dehalococcoidia bacterium]